MPKFRNSERLEIQSVVADLTIKRIPDSLIIKQIESQIGKTITTRSLRNIRKRIKRDSFKWYKALRQGEDEFIYEFKERINEIMALQRRHYQIIEDNANNPSIVQTSLAELHKLSITLSNLYDVAPAIVNTNPVKQDQNDNSIPIPQKDIIV